MVEAHRQAAGAVHRDLEDRQSRGAQDLECHQYRAVRDLEVQGPRDLPKSWTAVLDEAAPDVTPEEQAEEDVVVEATGFVDALKEDEELLMMVSEHVQQEAVEVEFESARTALEPAEVLEHASMGRAALGMPGVQDEKQYESVEQGEQVEDPVTD